MISVEQSTRYADEHNRWLEHEKRKRAKARAVRRGAYAQVMRDIRLVQKQERNAMKRASIKCARALERLRQKIEALDA